MIHCGSQLILFVCLGMFHYSPYHKSSLRGKKNWKMDKKNKLKHTMENLENPENRQTKHKENKQAENRNWKILNKLENREIRWKKGKHTKHKINWRRDEQEIKKIKVNNKNSVWTRATCCLGATNPCTLTLTDWLMTLIMTHYRTSHLEDGNVMLYWLL